MRTRFLIAALGIVVCLPAYAEPPNAPATEAPRVEDETQPNIWQRVLSTVIGARPQSTVTDRVPHEEVWTENEDAAPADEDVAASCNLCPQAPPARVVDPPLLTAPRN